MNWVLLFLSVAGMDRRVQFRAELDSSVTLPYAAPDQLHAPPPAPRAPGGRTGEAFKPLVAGDVPFFLRWPLKGIRDLPITPGKIPVVDVDAVKRNYGYCVLLRLNSSLLLTALDVFVLFFRGMLSLRVMKGRERNKGKKA